MAGEKYVRVVGIYDNEFQSNEFHPECHVAMEKYFAANRDETEFSPHACKRGTNEEYHPPQQDAPERILRHETGDYRYGPHGLPDPFPGCNH